MKIINLRKSIAAMLIASGMVVCPSVARALDHEVGDPGFEEIALGTLDYYYFQGPPNSPFWRDHSLSTGKNAVYTANGAINLVPEVPDPRSGSQAVDGEGAYNYQVLSDTFVAGRTYTYSAYIQGWQGATSDSQDRFWLYLFGGVGPTNDLAPGDASAPGTMDGSSIIRATWHQNGTIDGVFKTGTGDHSFLPFSGFNRDGGSAWTQVGLSYTATAADAGKRIGIGFWANELGAVDDIALVSEGPTDIPGDYDANGSVGPEDYETWKSGFGQTVPAGSGADGNANGIVDAADYTYWRDRTTAAGAAALSSTIVPESEAISLVVMAAGMILVASRYSESRF